MPIALSCLVAMHIKQYNHTQNQNYYHHRYLYIQKKYTKDKPGAESTAAANIGNTLNSLPPALPPPWNSLAVGQVGQVAEPKNGREEQQGAQGRQDLQKRQAEPVQRVEGKHGPDTPVEERSVQEGHARGREA